MTYIYNKDELYHFGIKGQKWGIRRFQNADGSLTDAGKRRYQNADGTLNKRGLKRQAKRDNVISFYKNIINDNNSANDKINYLKENYTKRKGASEVSKSIIYDISDDFKNSGYRSNFSKSFKVYKTKDEAKKAYLNELDAELKKK